MNSQTWTGLWVALWVGLGGGLGSVLRWGTGLAVAHLHRGDHAQAVATWTVNVVGSFALGALLDFRTGVSPAALATSAVSVPWSAVPWLAMLGTGLLGGFTTYSTFNYEALKLLQAPQPWRGVLYILVTVLVCLAAGALGRLAAQQISPAS